MNISTIQMKSELPQYHSQTKRNNSLSFTSTRGADLLEKIIEQKVTDKKQLSNLLKSLGFGRFGMFSKKQITEILEEFPKMFEDVQDKAHEQVVRAYYFVSEQNEAVIQSRTKRATQRAIQAKQKEFETIEAKLKEREAKIKEREEKLNEREQKNHKQEDMHTAQQKDEFATRKGWTKEQFISHILSKMGKRSFQKSELKDSELRNLAKLLGTTEEQVRSMDKQEYRRLSIKFHPDSARKGKEDIFCILTCLYNCK